MLRHLGLLVRFPVALDLHLQTPMIIGLIIIANLSVLIIMTHLPIQLSGAKARLKRTCYLSILHWMSLTG